MGLANLDRIRRFLSRRTSRINQVEVWSTSLHTFDLLHDAKEEKKWEKGPR
jgi:hypothetical protein